MYRLVNILFFILFFTGITAQPEIEYLYTDTNIITDFDDEFTLSIELEDNLVQDVDSITINRTMFLSFEPDIYINEIKTEQIVLHKDSISISQNLSKNLYTSNSIKLVLDSIYLNRPNYNVASLLFLAKADISFHIDDGQYKLNNQDVGLGITYVNKEILRIPKITQVSDSIQYSDHAINIVTDQKFNEPLVDQVYNKHLDVFGTLFEDDNDELIFGYTYPTRVGLLAGRHWNYNSNIQGICLEEIQDEQFPYAEGVTFMSWKNMNAGLFAHEYLHRFAAFCDPLGFVDNTGHWTPYLCSTTGFNFYYRSINSIGENEHQVRQYAGPRIYNEVELYFMGLILVDEIPFPIDYIRNAHNPIITPNIISLITWEGTRDTMYKEEFLQKSGGLRVPEFEPDVLRSSTVVFSNRLLTPLEMAYYDHQLSAFEYESTTRDTNNIYFATQGRLNHVTKLRKLGEPYIDFDPETGLPAPILVPNPGENIIRASFGTITAVRDIKGRLLIQENNAQTIDMSNLLPGIYLVDVIEEGVMFTVKFVKI